MSLPKLSIMVLALLLANLLMVAVSSVDPSEPADTSDGAAQRIGHLHLEGHGSDKITVTVQGDNLRAPRFANQDGAWHACADDLHGHDLTPSARMSCNDEEDDYASLLGGREHLKGLRVGKESALDALVKLARSAATSLDVSLILGNPQMEPSDIWKTMSCAVAVLISEQNGGAWKSKEAEQLRSMGFFSKEDVLKQLRVIMWPDDCSEPITSDRESM